MKKYNHNKFKIKIYFIIYIISYICFFLSIVFLILSYFYPDFVIQIFPSLNNYTIHISNDFNSIKLLKILFILKIDPIIIYLISFFLNLKFKKYLFLLYIIYISYKYENK